MKSWRYIKVHPDANIKIDTEDYEKVSQHSWRVTKASTGRERVVTSFRTPQGVRSVTLGKFLMNPPPGKQVYPRRFNEGLDYRKSNLIVCTLKERQRLLPKNRTAKSSSYRGVSYIQKQKKWRAAIEVKGRTVNLGNFSNEAEAAKAYNKAAKKYFGDVAYQNSIGRKQIKSRA